MTVPVKVKVVEIGLPTEPAIQAIEQALRQIEATVTKKDKKQGVWLAQTGMSWTTFGVTVRVSMTQNSGRCSIRVECEPIINTPITFTDSGASAGAIRNFEQSLSRIASRMLPEVQKKISDGLMCPICGRELLAGALFCPDDGTPIVSPCAKCGHNNPIGTKFCTRCGSKI